MEMTNSEIVRSYREAKDKGKQVKILSQLNLCEVGEILDILAKNGVKPQEMPRMRRVPCSRSFSQMEMFSAAALPICSFHASTISAGTD